MDPIRFEQDLQVTIQALGWRTESRTRYLPLQDDIASVAYWYQTLPTAPFPALPDRDVLRDHLRQMPSIAARTANGMVRLANPGVMSAIAPTPETPIRPLVPPRSIRFLARQKEHESGSGLSSGRGSRRSYERRALRSIRDVPAWSRFRANRSGLWQQDLLGHECANVSAGFTVQVRHRVEKRMPRLAC